MAASMAWCTGQLIQKLVSDTMISYYKATALQVRVIRKNYFKEIATMHQLSLRIQ
jgi:hypothetical protein